MTFDSAWDYESPRYRATRFDYGYAAANAVPLRLAVPQRLLGGTALAAVVFACAWTLYANLTGAPATDINGDPIEIAAGRGDRLDAVAHRGDKLAAATRRTATAAINDVMTLFDPRYTAGASPGTFVKDVFARRAPAPTDNQVASASLPAQDAGAKSASRVAQTVAAPIQIAPPLRNAALREHIKSERVAAADPEADATAPAAEQPGLLERIFGRFGAKKSNGPQLAYASPDDGLSLGGRGVAARYGDHTAVYDITAHVVYLPDGRRLEAHSGYGSLLDDPHHADVRMRGVTPPDAYDLTERESLFHGVRALRLIPKDESKVFGRSGLLAHTYMLGPNGDSNGCVSFRNYDAFLEAYLNGEVKHLVVVSSL